MALTTASRNIHGRRVPNRYAYFSRPDGVKRPIQFARRPYVRRHRVDQYKRRVQIKRLDTDRREFPFRSCPYSRARTRRVYINTPVVNRSTELYFDTWTD